MPEHFINPYNDTNPPQPRHATNQDHRTIGAVTMTTGVASAVVFILAWLTELLTAIEVPTEVQGALTVVVVFIAGYLVPPRAKD